MVWLGFGFGQTGPESREACCGQAPFEFREEVYFCIFSHLVVNLLYFIIIQSPDSKLITTYVRTE